MMMGEAAAATIKARSMATPAEAAAPAAMADAEEGGGEAPEEELPMEEDTIAEAD